jgi:hypothetical protein
MDFPLPNHANNFILSKSNTFRRHPFSVKMTAVHCIDSIVGRFDGGFNRNPGTDRHAHYNVFKLSLVILHIIVPAGWVRPVRDSQEGPHPPLHNIFIDAKSQSEKSDPAGNYGG